MKSHIDVMYDKRYSKLRETFEETLYQIQAINFEWFYKRTNPVTGEVPDKIYNYYRYYYDDHDEIALFLKSDLEPSIRLACVDAFEKVFKTG